MRVLAHSRERAPVLQIKTAAKCSSAAGENHDLARIIERYPIQCRMKFRDQIKVDCIQTIGTVEDDSAMPSSGCSTSTTATDSPPFTSIR